MYVYTRTNMKETNYVRLELTNLYFFFFVVIYCASYSKKIDEDV
jgi:hypothetical protein